MDRTQEDIQDEWLVLRCQAGDAEALKSLVSRWQPRLGRLARHLTGDREAARDAVQDAWLAIVRGLLRLDDPARFRFWAYRIVKNRCADWTRRRATRRRTLADMSGSTSPTGDAASNEVGPGGGEGGLRAAMLHLPGEQRAMLSLHYLDGLGVAEIARVLGIPVGTVKSRLFHARDRLKQSLERVVS